VSTSDFTSYLSSFDVNYENWLNQYTINPFDTNLSQKEQDFFLLSHAGENNNIDNWLTKNFGLSNDMRREVEDLYKQEQVGFDIY